MAAAARLSVWKSIALGACHYLVTCRRPQQLTAWLTFGGLDSLPRHLAFDGYGSLPLGSALDGLGSLPIGTALSDHGVSPQGMASTALTARPLAQGSIANNSPLGWRLWLDNYGSLPLGRLLYRHSSALAACHSVTRSTGLGSLPLGSALDDQGGSPLVLFKHDCFGRLPLGMGLDGLGSLPLGLELT